MIERLAGVAERNPKLRKAKIAQSGKSGTIACESVTSASSTHTANSARAHPRPPPGAAPLHREIENKHDLILVCANCRVMIHRHSPWKTPEQLKAHIADTSDQ